MIFSLDSKNLIEFSPKIKSFFPHYVIIKKKKLKKLKILVTVLRPTH